MHGVQETSLAWVLIEAAKPHLTLDQRYFLFVTVGAGDTFASMRELLRLIAAKHIPLRPHLVQLCTTWLDSYRFHEEHEYLRHLIEGFLTPTVIGQAALAISNPLAFVAASDVAPAPNYPVHLTITADPRVQDKAAKYSHRGYRTR